uniref:InlB B-repeat-containing protein n=1 Tax=uncultured Draconibacterium sp. TaxID=1573823 RepID=UPI0032176F75
MKRHILYLLFVIISSFVQAATIYVNVNNVNGSLVSGAYVKLYNSSWTLIKTGYTNSSGMATFALLDYGTYHYEVYYTGEVQEFWGSEENISLQSPTLTSNFTRYWPYRYSYNTPSSSVYTGNQVSFEVTIKNKVSFSRNVKVEIWVDRSKSSSWDFNQTSSAQSISSNGTKTFTFNFTPSSTGTYYWKMNVLSYNDGSGAYIITDSYSWSSAFSAENQESDLDIYVKNVNGSYIEDAYVKLYDENWNLEDDDYTNSSGRADFNNLEYGTYHYEVYYTGDAQEFWGGDENLNINSASESETFARNWPYRSNLTTSVDNSANYDVTVKNNLSFSRNVKVEIWVDRNQSTSGDFHELSSAQSVSSNGTKTFTFNFTPSTSGTYYYKMQVLTYNDGAGEYLVTDSYFWTESFSIALSTPFPLSDGILVYHAYTNYESTWDSKLYTYNFSTGTKKEISSGWNIDHEMNAVASPDGSKIVFMGDNSGEPRDWDIYIWDINSSSSPQNLTNGNNLRDEDPRFSPDGSKIIFKQNGDIKVMDLNGEILSNVTSDGSTNEESMPFFNANETKIVYARGAKATSDIYVINSDGTNQTPLYNESSLCEYFPVFKDNSTFFYTRWVSTNDEHDQIYLGDYSGNSERLSINEYTSDNSDASPVGSDYLFFSSTRNGSGYDLFLGQISTGEVWNLNDFGINSTKEDLGACFIANQSFNISASASPSNGGSLNGTGSYNSGATANLTATVASGYDFVNWTENGTQVSTNANYSFTVTSNRTLVANFEAKTYNISASASPSNGGSVSGSGSYSSGATANLTVTAASGYDFVNWTENGTQVSTNANYSFTVTSIRTLVANFEAKTYNISLSASPSNGGSVSGSGGYSSGATANLSATAASGYDFVNWTENGTQVSTNANYSFTVTSNRTLIANFEYQVLSLNSVIISGESSVNEDSSADYTCIANYSDGSTQDVTSSASWSVSPTTYATIGSSTGVLTTGSVSSDKSCTITASYGGKSDTHSLMIKNVINTNHPPNKPILISPANGERLSGEILNFDWSCTDEDNDVLYYKILLGENSGEHVEEIKTDEDYFVSAYDQREQARTIFWIVRAYDGQDSTSSDESYFIIPGTSNTQPEKPVLILPADGDTSVYYEPLKFEWSCNDADGDALEYLFEIGDSPTNTLQTWAKNVPEITLYGETEDIGKTYYWKVKAYDGKKWSEYSEARKITFIDDGEENTAPSVPILITPSDGERFFTNDTITFSWQQAEDPENDDMRYELYLKTESGDWRLWQTISGTIQHGHGESAQSYFWKVRAVDYRGAEGDFSEIRSFVVDWPTSVEDINVNDQIKIYPNPTHQFLTIEFVNSYGHYHYELYDNIGRLIIQGETGNKLGKIDLKGKVSGMYILKIYNNEFSKTEKIIVR